MSKRLAAAAGIAAISREMRHGASYPADHSPTLPTYRSQANFFISFVS